jgi:amidase
VAEHDHEVVRRLRGAGAVVLGTSRQLANASRHWADPVTRNPWRGDRSPGGASAGSAAAVAAGVVPIAHATGRLGSMRIPAASCGLVGITPGADIGDDPDSEHGIIATTVADAALGYAAVAGRSSVLEQAATAALRGGVDTSPVPFVGPDRSSRAAVQRGSAADGPT